MRDLTRYDYDGPWRRSWTLRAWGTRLGWWWLRSLLHGWYGLSVWLRTHPGGTYYCPTGSTSEVRIAFAGFGVWLWCSRDRGPVPCLCDLACWDAVPESYTEEIEDYGGIERVREEIERRIASPSPAEIPA